jgi:hypothetical protein
MSKGKTKDGYEKDIILFAGQSGIKMEKCMEKLREKNSKLQVDIIKLEKTMIETYKKDHGYEDWCDRDLMTEILSEPPLKQTRLWTKSFDIIGRKLKSEASERVYFLSFHASFYNQRNREFLSPINIQKLNSLRKRTKMIIVFIDDCYDIYRRLLSNGEMFHSDIISANITPQEAIFRSIWNLLSILSWREIETAFSRKIAEVLEIPIFVIAVKHPTFMVQRLVFAPLDDLRIFYLSHPITSIRKRIYARGMKFPEKMNTLIETCLNKEKSLVLFIPDTIDELRIKNTDNMYIPELEEGWSLPYDDDKWLFCPLPDEAMAYHPLNPKNFKVNSATKASISIKSMSKSHLEIIHW